jgi:hypothetical protein
VEQATAPATAQQAQLWTTSVHQAALQVPVPAAAGYLQDGFWDAFFADHLSRYIASKWTRTGQYCSGKKMIERTVRDPITGKSVKTVDFVPDCVTAKLGCDRVIDMSKAFIKFVDKYKAYLRDPQGADCWDHGRRIWKPACRPVHTLQQKGLIFAAGKQVLPSKATLIISASAANDAIKSVGALGKARPTISPTWRAASEASDKMKMNTVMAVLAATGVVATGTAVVLKLRKKRK